MYRLWLTLFAVLGTGLFSGQTSAADRVALVIGNSNYPAAGTLANPANDATAVATSLQGLGFTVDLEIDLNAQNFRDTLKGFADEAAKAEIAIVYYAGHGVEFDGINYLVPTDAKMEKKADVRFEAISLEDVRQAASGASKLRLIILDACRSNPFPMVGKDGQRALSRGLSKVEPNANELIAYSARENTVAADGAGENSPFAVSFLNRLAEPGVEVNFLFRRVRDDVLQATGKAQEPFVYGTLGVEEIFLHPGVASPEPQASPAPASLDASTEWLLVKNSRSRKVLEAYRAKFAGDPVYSALAEERLALFVPKPEVPKTAPAVPGCADILVSVARHQECLKAGDVFRDFDGGPSMVVVPAGQFIMGSPPGEANREDNEGPRHKVTFANAFAVGRFEITFGEWDACAKANACDNSAYDNGWPRGKRPAINISWLDAKQYVAWLSKQTGKAYHLLSEAEWEYAARAGAASAYSFGDTIKPGLAQYDLRETVGVGTFDANAFGIYDMHGNVSEWVADCFAGTYEGAADDGTAVGGADCAERVYRGGSWASQSWKVRAAYRAKGVASYRDNEVGFRVARAVDLP